MSFFRNIARIALCLAALGGVFQAPRPVMA